MNGKRSANYLFIRKTISNIIARRFALESEIFSRQYGNTISIDINHQRRELNFIFRTPGGRFSSFSHLMFLIFRWWSCGNRYPKPLWWREILRSNVPDRKSLGKHESSVQVNTCQLFGMLFIWHLLQQSSGRVGRVPWQYKQKTDLENFVGFRPPEAGLPVHLHQVGWNRKNSGNIH